MTTAREITLAKSEIQHPETVDGRNLWVAPEVQDLMDRLHYGDATLGWEGDPRLALYRAKGQRWELRRLEANGHMSLVCRSRPGLDLDNRLIMHLVAHDTRRGYDVADDVDLHNAANEAARGARINDRAGAATDKLLWALRKDVGHLY